MEVLSKRSDDWIVARIVDVHKESGLVLSDVWDDFDGRYIVDGEVDLSEC